MKSQNEVTNKNNLYLTKEETNVEIFLVLMIAVFVNDWSSSVHIEKFRALILHSILEIVSDLPVSDLTVALAVLECFS